MSHSIKKQRRSTSKPSIRPPTASRLVPCPCCGRHIHRLLLNDHLESPQCLRTFESIAPPSESTSMTPAYDGTLPTPMTAECVSTPPDLSVDYHSMPPPPPALHPATASDGEVMVRCPMCDMSLRNEDAFAHVESCTGLPANALAAGSSSAGSPGGGGSSDVIGEGSIHCPACGALCANVADLNVHLDAGCPPPARDRSESGAGSSTASATVVLSSEGLDQLAAEVRCSLCFDIFDDPQSLPCHHSFCLECILGCFRVTNNMHCPLCKAPTWRRQVTPDHKLRAIVAAFRALAPERC